MRGNRGKAVLHSTWQMRGGMDAAGVGWHGQGGAMWYHGRGEESGARGEVKKEKAFVSTCPALAPRCAVPRWHGVAYGRSYQRGKRKARQIRCRAPLGCGYSHHYMLGRNKLPCAGRGGRGIISIISKLLMIRRGGRARLATSTPPPPPPSRSRPHTPPLKNWTRFQLMVHCGMAEISVKKNLTGKTLDMFLDKISRGMSLTAACGACGVSPNRLDKLRKDKPKLNAQVLAAQAQAEEMLVNKIMESRDGKLALAFLQSRFSHWSPKTTGSGNSPAKSTVSPELLAQLSSIPERVKKRN